MADCSLKFVYRIQVLFSIMFGIMVSVQSKPADYVNPLIGTAGHGHTFPGPTVPFGMVQLGPDTDTEGWDWCSGYNYADSSIMGFSHTHLSGTGCADYGDILFMPTTGVLKSEPGAKDKPGSGYRSKFSHNNETAKPGYYSVILDDHNIKAELTATRRAGFQKYTFPKTDSANIIIDLVHGIQNKTTDSKITIINNNIIKGYRRVTGWAKDRCIYFYAVFSKPFKSFGIIENKNIYKGKSNAEGNDLKAFVKYKTSKKEVILIKVGISSVSLKGAEKNLGAEIPGWNFNNIVKLADNEWNKALSSISVETENNDNKKTFYTALYHALLAPNTFSDIDGSYIGMDKKIHTIKNRDMYTVFSLWDTFRAENPLLTIIDKKRAQDMVEALILKYKENGLLPVWELASNETGTMIGYHAVPVIADAYFKGLRNFDIKDAFDAMKKSAMQDDHGLKYYKEMGYIPADLEDESVSKTLEYSYDDWCIAMMAKDLGKTADYNYFIQRAKFYSNVFDPSTTFMRGKKNGKWREPFDPLAVNGDYTEANAWQYSFFVLQDINALINLMGGCDKFNSKLDTLFTTNSNLTGNIEPDITGMIGQYSQGDEPSHHMAYLYNYSGEPWKTEEKVHQLVTTLYTDKLDGLCGNDDCGQMSAWYVLSSVGFYPVCPGDNKYIIGTPLFNKVVINTGGGKRFSIVAHNLSDKNFYIESASLNGKEYNYSFIDYADIAGGGNLVFEMGSTPGKWGTGIKSRPESLINIPFVTVPFLTSGNKVFADSTVAELSSTDSQAKIYYTIDGSDPMISRQLYSAPVKINNTTILKAVAFENGNYSKMLVSNFNKVPAGRSIKLYSKYSDLYSGGGPLGLIDGIKGTSNFHTEAWQGYEGNDLDAVVDLGKVQKISLISTSFLQNTTSWIFYPQLIEYSISSDGVNYIKVYEMRNIADEKNSGAGVKNFDRTFDGIEARYVKVFAKNVGLCPDWHVAAGNKAWLFVDEISIK
jgi:predicted alpha-1,2-mannosidase